MNLKGGVIIIGSLLWDDEKERKNGAIMIYVTRIDLKCMFLFAMNGVPVLEIIHLQRCFQIYVT